ncbi:ATP-dependent DNA ligase [Nigerium massiliense]|uniref:ATP-dependent DNA ligase n=1 Tax=Nigerium massiliense TaxID=1522317 RepID=UPI0005910D20|nr:ATP-dependent DNA ligase [Nigerium massiliense]
MELAIPLPIDPMLAKAVTKIPAPDSVPGGLSYEPKWDGFRCIILRDGDEVELSSRGGKPLTRYFPEVVDFVKELLPEKVAVDGELVVRQGEPGRQRLHWEALSQRIHPAASRVAKLAEETPAEFIAFDLLTVAQDALVDRPFAERRARLVEVCAHLTPSEPVHLTRTTDDPELAERWFSEFEGAGLDGVVAKPLADPYSPGKRTMLKIKHSRTAELVPYGYRVHKSGSGVGSILLGLYDADGNLLPVGGASAFTNAYRQQLVDELEPLVVRDDDGEVVKAATDRSRFSGSKDTSFVPLQPELVIEVQFDQLEGNRLRHAARFLRWRPDRDPRSCTLAQIERAPEYDLAEVLADPAKG